MGSGWHLLCAKESSLPRVMSSTSECTTKNDRNQPSETTAFWTTSSFNWPDGSFSKIPDLTGDEVMVHLFSIFTVHCFKDDSGEDGLNFVQVSSSKSNIFLVPNQAASTWSLAEWTWLWPMKPSCEEWHLHFDHWLCCFLFIQRTIWENGT